MYKLWSCHVRCLYPDTTTTHRHGLSVLVDDFEDAVNDGTIHLQLLRKVGSRSAESIACTSASCECKKKMFWHTSLLVAAEYKQAPPRVLIEA